MTFDQWWDQYTSTDGREVLSDYEKDVARDAWNALDQLRGPKSGTPDALKVAAGNAINKLESLGRTFSGVNFTDRYGDGPHCLMLAKALKDALSDATKGKLMSKYSSPEEQDVMREEEAKLRTPKSCESQIERWQRRYDEIFSEKRRAGWTHSDVICAVAMEAATEAAREARKDTEQLQVQLAGCSVAALGGTSTESVAKRGDYGWSQSYQDVLDLRGKYERAALSETKRDDEIAKASELLEAVRGWVHARAFSDSIGLLTAEYRLNETFRKVVGLGNGLDHAAQQELQR